MTAVASRFFNFKRAIPRSIAIVRRAILQVGLAKKQA